MRHVVTNSEVAHLWANQSQDSARNAGHSMSFRGRELFSYSTRVGLITDATLHGKQVVLLLNYPSHATGRHVSLGWRALDSERYEPIHVDSLRDVDSGERSHTINLESKYEAYKKSVVRLLKPHVYSYHGETLEQRERTIYELATPYREYAMAFGLQEPWPAFDAYVNDLREAFKRYYDPKQVSKRDHDNAVSNLQRARSFSRMYAVVEGVLPVKTLHNITWDKRTTLYELRSAILSILSPYKPARAVTPEQWQQGEGTMHQYGFEHTLIRRNKDMLETNMGARVSWQDALRTYKLAQHYRGLHCSNPYLSENKDR